MTWATRTRNKVHEITPLVKEVIAMSYCNNCRTVAKVLGCSCKSVERIRQQLRSTAHIFLTKETLEAMR